MSARVMDPSREKLGLNFDGTLHRKGKLAVLRPRADPRCGLALALSEVRESGDRVQGLQGARVEDSHIEEGTVFAESGGTYHPACGGRNYCIGQLEVCCEGGVTIGPCEGEWGC